MPKGRSERQRNKITAIGKSIERIEKNLITLRDPSYSYFMDYHKNHEICEQFITDILSLMEHGGKPSQLVQNFIDADKTHEHMIEGFMALVLLNITIKQFGVLIEDWYSEYR